MPGHQATFDTIVLGAAGAMGSSACLHLARRGRRILGIDQFAIAHDRGSSHGLSRMIRLCYSEHSDYVPLLRRAYQLWRELERDAGETILSTPGGLYMGPPECETVAGALAAARLHGLEHRSLSRIDLEREYPQFAVPEEYVGFFEPEAGWLRPERAIAAQARLAAASGATIRTGERVLEWSAVGQGVSVRTDLAEYRAESLVIAAGAWAGRVVRDLGVTISPTRQALGWVRPRKASLFASGTLPVWAIHPPDDLGPGIFYGFPMSGEGELGEAFKLARHAPGLPIDPDTSDRAPRPEDEQDLRPFIRRFIPEADGPWAETRICMYENSPDSHFIIDRHPHHANVILAAGFSGHGFKFATVVGEVLADLATRGRTDHPIGFLSLGRFRAPRKS